MRPALVLLLAVAALAGCGADERPAAPATVRVDGGTLVDARGAVLYTSEQEADGTIRCTGACLGFWLPATVDGTPTAGEDVPGELGVLERDDGTRQLTYDGVPVYRFSEDAPGEVTGDGLSDEFGGKEFTWHAVTVGDGERPDSGRGAYGY